MGGLLTKYPDFTSSLPFGNQVFVDEVFRETQLSGISHWLTAPVRGFLNAAEPPCRACRHRPQADARSRARKRLRHEASVSGRHPQPRAAARAACLYALRSAGLRARS